MNTLIRHRPIGLVALATGALMLGACGGADAAASGEVLIESEIADLLLLGPLEATCEPPAEQAEGERFSCTATTENGDVVGFDGVFTSDSEISIVSNNVVLPDDIDTLVALTVESINATIDGAAATAADISCPDGPLILDDGAFECTIVNPAEGLTYPLTIDTGGLVDGAPVDISWEIGDALSR